MSWRITNRPRQPTKQKAPVRKISPAGLLVGCWPRLCGARALEPRVRSTNPRSTITSPPLFSSPRDTGRRLFSRTLARCSMGAKFEIATGHTSLETYLWAYRRGNQPAVRMRDRRDLHASERAGERRFICKVFSPGPVPMVLGLVTHTRLLALLFSCCCCTGTLRIVSFLRRTCKDIARICDCCRSYLIG